MELAPTSLAACGQDEGMFSPVKILHAAAQRYAAAGKTPYVVLNLRGSQAHRVEGRLMDVGDGVVLLEAGRSQQFVDLREIVGVSVLANK